jgi:hypothetical protein
MPTDTGDPPQTVDPLERVAAALAKGTRTRRVDVQALHDEVRRLRDLVDADITYKDIELKIRDGHFDLTAIGQDGGHPATKFLAAIMLNAILGDGNEEPPNYRGTEVHIEHYGDPVTTQAEMGIKPAGEFRPLRLWMEVVKPGGKTSHEIRQDLERELARARAS